MSPPTRGLNDFKYIKSFLFTYTHYSLIIEMIEICQWRASIGLWACHQISYSTCAKISPNADNSTIDGLTTIRRIKDLTFTLGLFLLLLLILSGDVELNPGPKTGNLLKNNLYTLYLVRLVHIPMQSLASCCVACLCQFMNTMRSQCTNMTCHNAGIESNSIFMFQAMHLSNQISIMVLIVVQYMCM